MGNNNFTETFVDGASLTQAMLESAFKSLTLDISNTTQMTSGSTSGTFLKSNGDGVAATWGTPSDPLGPFAIRNYGLAAAASVGALTISLKTNAAGDPSSTDKVNLTFSSNGSSSATYTAVDATAATSLAITSSASLGFANTSTSRVYVYAINVSGTPRLAVSARADFDSATSVTTTAMSSSADSPAVLYSSAATAVLPRLLGYVEAAHNSTGAWQSPSKVNVINNIAPAKAFTSAGRTTGSATAELGGVAISSSSGTFSTSATAATAVTNLSCTITTSGRPIRIETISDGAGSESYIQSNLSASSTDTDVIFIRTLSGADTEIGRYLLSTALSGTTANTIRVPGSIGMIDTPAAGTYTYKIQVKNFNAGTTRFYNSKLVVYEL